MIDRELRADARRNRQLVLQTAQQLFAAEGLDVPLDEIARRAGVGPGTVHRHFPAKEALYLAVAIDMLRGIVAEAAVLAASDDPEAIYTLLSGMIAAGAQNAAVKSALAAAEFDLRTAAPDIATDLNRHVTGLLERGHRAGVVRSDATADEAVALVAGAFAAIHHSGAANDPGRSAHLGQIILDGLRPPATS